MSGCSRTGVATVRHLVVVSSPESATTDDVADLLRDSCTVRTAYTTAGVLDRLDPDVDVALVDPGLSDDAVDAVRTAVDERDLDCQVGLLAPEDVDAGPADVVVPPGAPDDVVQDRVAQLATRARYRKTLEEYYDIARTSAQLNGADADTDAAGDDAEERERLEARLDRLSRRLDEVAEPLDAPTLFRTVLDRDEEW